MPVQKQSCMFSCLKMDIEDGQIENEYDFAEDAMDFETQLAEAKDVTFTQTLQEPLSIGSHITCTGTPEDLPWFALNIGQGDAESGKADIAVHFNVRLPQCYVVRNTRRNAKWGAEETTAFRMFPFKMGRPFTIEVLIDEEMTLFAVDGEHYCGYAHRAPTPLTATFVQVAGIRDAALVITKTDVYPKLAPPVDEIASAAALVHDRAGGQRARGGVAARQPAAARERARARGRAAAAPARRAQRPPGRVGRGAPPARRPPHTRHRDNIPHSARPGRVVGVRGQSPDRRAGAPRLRRLRPGRARQGRPLPEQSIPLPLHHFARKRRLLN